MPLIGWLGVLVLTLLACAGTIVSVLGAVLSSMAFDAPRSGEHVWPYLIGFGLPLLALVDGILLLRGLRLVRIRKVRSACACFLVPALVGIGALVFLRS